MPEWLLYGRDSPRVRHNVLAHRVPGRMRRLARDSGEPGDRVPLVARGWWMFQAWSGLTCAECDNKLAERVLVWGLFDDSIPRRAPEDKDAVQAV